jgi:hypothetical protein
MINVMLLCINFGYIATNWGNIDKIKQNMKDIKDLESAYKFAICIMMRHHGGNKTHIATTTLEGKPIEFDCPLEM